MTKILHICPLDKFIPPFVDFIEQNFTFSKHEFRVFGKAGAYYLKPRPNIHIAKRGFLGRVKAYSQLIISMHQAKKIILHSLFIPPVVKILWAMPWLLKKCYWVMWGGDLYVYSLGEKNKEWKRSEFFRRPVINRMGYFVSYIYGDYEYAQEWYSAKGQYKECLMYPSNLYVNHPIEEKKHDAVNILVGNSADPLNNHIEIFEKLEKYKNDQINIYVPLSYGNKNNAEIIFKEGVKRFGDKFKPLVEYLLLEEYVELLSKIDVAIFNHKRQQAMGNIITLLGLGVKVYMRSDVTQWSFFEKHEIKVFDIKGFNLKLQDGAVKKSNEDKVRSLFSFAMYKKQLEELFH